MSEITFNKSIRTFLKKVGITSQQDIEKAIQERVESGQVTGNQKFDARMTLEIPELDLKVVIDGEIKLE